MFIFIQEPHRREAVDAIERALRGADAVQLALRARPQRSDLLQQLAALTG